ncbi:MAG: hypothetical protein OHK0052_11390 [Anaerolineales bacterium]
MKRSLPVLIFIIAIIARILPGARTIDDSYITFRYARNILAGNGFTYNPDERVMGTTTPLYTGIMATLGAVSGGVNAPFPELALIINALADSITCLLLYKLGSKLGYPLGGTVAALAYGIAPWSVTFAIGGLETSVYILLLTLSAYFYNPPSLPSPPHPQPLSQREGGAGVRATAIFGALALLTRPDALILLAPIALHYLITQILPRKTSLTAAVRAALPALLLLGAWYTFAWLYFGSPIPHSVSAKVLAYHLNPEEALVRLLQHYTTPFLVYEIVGMWWVGVGLILYPFLYIIGAQKIYRAAPNLLPWLLYPWLYFTVFAIANPLIFRWYLTPPLPAYFLTILIGLEHLWRPRPPQESGIPQQSTRGLVGTRLSLGRRAALGLFLIPLLAPLTTWTLHPDHGANRPAPEMAWIQLELHYRRAAEILQPYLANSSQPVTLAAGDVGVLGFVTNARILDTVGLNSPISSTYYPIAPEDYAINYAIPTQLILAQQPDYIVIQEVYARNTFLQDTRFWQQYNLLYTIPNDIYGSQGMLIFAHK